MIVDCEVGFYGECVDVDVVVVVGKFEVDCVDVVCVVVGFWKVYGECWFEVVEELVVGIFVDWCIEINLVYEGEFFVVC